MASHPSRSWPRLVDTVASPANAAQSDPAGDFAHFGLEVEYHRDVAHALIAIGGRTPALVVLPCDVYGMDTGEVVDAVAHGTNAPVVVAVSAASETAVRALDSGAVGLVGLPLAAAEIDAAVRRWNPGATTERQTITAGTLVVDMDAHRVTLDGLEVPLSAREFELLRVLAAQHERVLTLGDLAREMSSAEPDHLRVMLGRIRRKLAGASPGSGVRLETVRGVGFRIASR